jgi:subtilisin family serine protease
MIKTSPVTTTVVSKYSAQSALSNSRIRIAVLDTGYDPNAIFFQARDRERRIKGWKDYVEKNNTGKPKYAGRDEDGHGTHVLSVLMTVAPAADIYIARVARNTPELENASQNIADVSDWISHLQASSRATG